MAQRISLVIEFDGFAFHGWQRQINASSVQGTIEEALLKIEQVQVPLVAAGRTDSGVHAEALLIHADVSLDRWQRSPKAYTHGLNQLLPDSVRVTGVRAVEHDFHARFDCLERRYRYQIWNRSTASAIDRWRHWWMPRRIDEVAMSEAANLILGEHDFSSFRAAGCQAAHAVREVRHIEVERQGWQVSVAVHADAFLYHMVRNIVGSLVMVGIGEWPVSRIGELLALKDRSEAGATAPAHGLYFTDALYRGFTAREIIGTHT